MSAARAARARGAGAAPRPGAAARAVLVATASDGQTSSVAAARRGTMVLCEIHMLSEYRRIASPPTVRWRPLRC